MEWIIKDCDSNPIANFYPAIIEAFVVHVSDAPEPELNIKLQLTFLGQEPSNEFTVCVSELDHVEWLDKDVRCRFHPKMSKVKARRYMTDLIRKELSTVELKQQHRISKLGLHIVKGVPVFNIGGGLISPSAGINANFEITSESLPYNMDVDINLSEEEAAKAVIDLIDLCPNAGRIILVQNVMYLLRKLYEDAWKSPCCCIFLYGKTGLFKTTFSAFMTQLHNRLKGILSPPRLNASIPAAVKLLYEKTDCAVVLDDLFPADSKEYTRKQEETLIEITRIIGDGVPPARMRGNTVEKEPPKCGVVFTGEYLIGTGSDAARILPVEMTPIDGGELKKHQDRPLVLSTFYYNFMHWVVDNFDDILELMKDWLEVYRKTQLGVHDRLRETHYFFNTAYAILLQYLHEKGIVSEGDAHAMHYSFKELLADLIEAQQKRVEQGKLAAPPVIDFWGRIVTMYSNGLFLLS